MTGAQKCKHCGINYQYASICKECKAAGHVIGSNCTICKREDEKLATKLIRTDLFEDLYFDQILRIATFANEIRRSGI